MDEKSDAGVEHSGAVKHDEKPKQIGITVKKGDNFSDWFTQVVSSTGADLADIRYGVQGCVVHKPWAVKIAREMYSLLEKEVEDDGHEPYLYPTMIPEENLLKEKEHAGFTPDVFWVETAGTQKLDRRLALRPTGETQFYPMFSLWIRSHTDLPLKTYQSRMTVFRNEMTTRPFLRGREFMFFETHDAFATHGQALKQVETDKKIMDSVIRGKLKIPFYFFKRPSWDTFLGAMNTYTADTMNPDGRRNQISSTHDLGQNFAKAFDITYRDDAGKPKFVWQTCFGPGIWRIIAALIAVHGDDQGLILPSVVAPLHAVVVPITFAKNPEASAVALKFAKLVDKRLKKWGYRAHLDDSDAHPGFKYNHWEMLGVPYRIEIGPREAEQKQVTIVNRISKVKKTASLIELKNSFDELLEEHDVLLGKRSDEYFSKNTRTTSSLSEIKSIIEQHRGFLIVPWCSTENEGKGCAEILKAETQGAYVCGERLGSDEKVNSTDVCAVCGKLAKHAVYVAKSI